MNRDGVAKIAFFLAVLFTLVPWRFVSPGFERFVPPLALLLGTLLALLLGNPYPDECKRYSRTLLQISVVLLGFTMDLNKVLKAGEKGLIFAPISILCVFLLGWGVQRLLLVRPITGLLVSTGTAICGGSAIAAMSTVVDAPQEDVSVSVGTVFLLNAVALLTFPVLGHAMGLTPEQFGTWAGIAIHDVSSVVGAGQAFGGGALEMATAVKLSRVLYLVPIVVIAAIWLRRRNRHSAFGNQRSAIPWFIGFFLLASLAGTYIPLIHDNADMIKVLPTAGLSLSLFLIGSGLTVKTLRQVGMRPLLQGVILWVFISVFSLLAVRNLG